MKIANRVLVCFASIVLIVLMLGLFSLMQIAQVREEGQKIENDALPGIALGDDIALAFSNTRTDVVRLLSVDKAKLPEAYASTQKKQKQFHSAVELYRPLIGTDAEQAAIDTIVKLFATYSADTEASYNLLKDGKHENAQELVMGKMVATADQIKEQLKKIETINDDAKAHASAAAEAAYSSAKLVIGIVLVMSLLYTLTLAWRLIVSLAGPISQALGSSEKIDRRRPAQGHHGHRRYRRSGLVAPVNGAYAGQSEHHAAADWRCRQPAGIRSRRTQCVDAR
ncbi:MCP four helix bundle domain-containing protein [Pseudomonas asplenii]|uniref:MCP four helix bundle domain-containing protein n=1 Tax=Pseudomonas asplenii TaxID=53407 RepID=UPI003B431EB8